MGKVKKSAKAAKAARVADAAGPTTKAGLEKAADTALAAFDYETAAARYEDILRMDASDTDTMDKLGEILITYVGDDQRGMAVLLESIRLAPGASSAKYMTVAQMYGGAEGLQYYKTGAEAIAQMMQKPGVGAEEMSELKEAMAQCFCAVAELWTTDLCLEDGAEHQCKAALDFAKQHNQNNVELHYLYAQLYLRLDDFENSKASLAHALKLLEYLDEERQPSTDIKIEIGKLLMQVQEWDEAYLFLKSLLVEDDGNGYLYYLMGETLKRLGKFTRAMRHLKRAKAIATRLVQNTAAAPPQEGEEGPQDFLNKVDELLTEIATQVSAQDAQKINAAGEDGFVTDSEDEEERQECAQGESALKQTLATGRPFGM